jgi:hypothetical protein
MDFRIERKPFLNSFYILLFLFISCKVKTIPDSQSKGQKFLIDEFKTLTFISCLKHGFSESTSIDLLLSEDKSYNQDYVLGNCYGYIDTLGIMMKSKIKSDSIIINRPYQNNLEEYKSMIGKRVFYICLHYYSSHELDSIANVKVLKNHFR